MSLETTSVFHPPASLRSASPLRGDEGRAASRFSQANMRGDERGAAPAFFTLPAGGSAGRRPGGEGERPQLSEVFA
jgi:hypothetical protein